MLKYISALLVVAGLVAGCGGAAVQPPTAAPKVGSSLSDAQYLWCNTGTGAHGVSTAAVGLGIVNDPMTNDHDTAFIAMFGILDRSALESNPLFPEYARACIAAYDQR